MTSTRTTMQLPAPPALATLGRALRSTKAEYRNSFGTKVYSHSFYRYAVCHFWSAIDEANRIWTSSVQPQIVELLLDKRAELRPSTVPNTVQEPHFALKCYMIGTDTDHAHPHAVVICHERFLRDKVREIVLRHGLLQRVGWGRAFLRFEAEIEQSAGESQRDGNLGTAAPEEHVVYSIADKLPRNLCGAGIEIRVGKPPWRTATMGGIIEIDEKYYGLTVAHIFEEKPIEHSKYTPATSAIDESDLDLFEDDALDESVSIYTKERTISETLGHPTMTDLNPQIVDSSNLGFPPPSTVTTEEHIKSSIRLGVLEESSKNRSTVESDLSDLDWALVAIEHPELCGPNKPALPGFEALENSLILTHVGDAMPDEGAKILIATGVTGVVTATSTLSTCSLHLKGAGRAVEAWTLRLNQTSAGDCGSWAINAANDDLLGVLIAACNVLQEAYIVPAKHVIDDIKSRKGSKIVRLPQKPFHTTVVEASPRAHKFDKEQKLHRKFDRDSDETVKLLALKDNLGDPGYPLRRGFIRPEFSIGAYNEIESSSSYPRSYVATLRAASEAGDIARIKELLNVGKDVVDSKDMEGQTPLLWAAKHGHETVVKLLLETGKVEVDSKDENGRTPLFWAAGHGHEAVVKLLLETGQVEIDLKDTDGRTPLVWAAGNGHEAVVKLLLETGQVDVDSKDKKGRTSLFWAAGERNEAVVKLLLETGKVEVDSKDKKGRTPLFWAACCGHQAVVKLLLETGQVEVDLKDTDGRTPLAWAASHGNEAVVKLLLETGQVEVDLKDTVGRTPLFWAAGLGRESVVKLLLETGQVDVNLEDTDGRTPLFWAAGLGSESVVKLLLETGQVEIDLKDTDGRTPLVWAAGNGHEAVVKLLLETGQVEVDSKDTVGRTPLSWAAGERNEAVVKVLLETGQVDVNLEDEDGQTPLFWAVKQGNEAVVKLLLETGQVDVDSEDMEGQTPLSLASAMGHHTVLKLLRSWST